MGQSPPSAGPVSACRPLPAGPALRPPLHASPPSPPLGGGGPDRPVPLSLRKEVQPEEVQQSPGCHEEPQGSDATCEDRLSRRVSTGLCKLCWESCSLPLTVQSTITSLFSSPRNGLHFTRFISDLPFHCGYCQAESRAEGDVSGVPVDLPQVDRQHHSQARFRA